MGQTDAWVSRKQALLGGLRALAEATPQTLGDRLGRVYAADAHWRGSHPLDPVQGPGGIAESVWAPLLRAMPDLERRDQIFVGGEYEGRSLIAAMGHYCGRFRQDWLGIPATGRMVFLRYGEIHELDGGQIRQSWCLWDLLDLMRQAGVWPLGPSLGVEMTWPGPLTADGVVLHATDPAESAGNLAQTLAMHQTLHDYDDFAGQGRDGLLAMPQRLHWHPKMMWYGPAGIGSTRALAGFVDDHQWPFRMALPNRPGNPAPHPARAPHVCRIGDGAYTVTGGWGSVRGPHLGGTLMGLPPTGLPVVLRVMDFYLHHEGLIRENWVPIDIIDMLRQMSVDVFARMRAMLRRPG